MGQPIWQIRAQNLGTIAENIFFEYELEAIDTDTQPVTYSLIAGILPVGIQLTGTAISGIPIKITGVPADVDLDTTSKFSIRATTTTNEVSDITLDLTVSGQTNPEIVTASGQLGVFFYGDFVDIQLDAIDLDVNDTITWSVINNTLPDGLELEVDSVNDRIAYIRGYPIPATALPEGIVPGFDAQDFDEDLGEFGFDFGLNTVDKLFEFNISITDGVGFDSSTFSIFLKGTLIFFSADIDTIKVDALIPTADATVSDSPIDPIMVTTAQDLGTVLHDNHFAFQFAGLDFEGDLINFRESPSFSADINTIFADTDEQTADTTVVRSLPQSLILDATTGWLHGTLDVITTTSVTFTFDIVSFKVANPTFISDPVTFTMTVISDLNNSLIINSLSNMTINNGEISELAIDAVLNSETDFNINSDSTLITVDQLFPTVDIDTTNETLSIDIKYELVEGSGSLPVGLALTSTGLIVGRPSFTHFQLDGRTTTFDDGDTVFDGTHKFDVRIIDITLGVIDQIQTFSITVNPINITAYENLYLVSGPTLAERTLYALLINDSTIIPRKNVYRNADPYFGVQPDLRFLLVDGLTPGSPRQYDTTLENNHYTRRFSFSDLKIAKAVDDNNNPSYELIYANIVDRLENNGNSIGQELIVDGVDASDLTNRIPPATPQFDNQGNIIIRPASIVNMRNIVIAGSTALTADNTDTFKADQNDITTDERGFPSGQLNLNTLPSWMTTTQNDGRVLGWIPGTPLVYCLPGEASQILFDINQSGFNLNAISFDVDRYVWDNNLTTVLLEYFLTLDDTEASFDDIDPNGSFVGGTGHVVLDEITLTSGAIIRVDAIVIGVVSAFTITTIGSKINSNIEILQSSTTGSGINFTLTPIRPSDKPDINDGLIKFPKINVFQ